MPTADIRQNAKVHGPLVFYACLFWLSMLRIPRPNCSAGMWGAAEQYLLSLNFLPNGPDKITFGILEVLKIQKFFFQRFFFRFH